MVINMGKKNTVFSIIIVIFLMFSSVSIIPNVLSKPSMKNLKMIREFYDLGDMNHSNLQESIIFSEDNSTELIVIFNKLLKKGILWIIANDINFVYKKFKHNRLNSYPNLSIWSKLENNTLTSNIVDFGAKTKTYILNLSDRDKTLYEIDRLAEPEGIIGGAFGLIIGLILWLAAICVAIPLSFVLFIVTVVLLIFVELIWAAGLPEFAFIVLLIATIPLNLALLSGFIGVFFPLVFMFIGLF